MSNTTDPLEAFGTNIATPQNQKALDRPEQVSNNAGGFVFEVDKLTQLRRFLTMGVAKGTYYVEESELTIENGLVILALMGNVESHKQAVDTIVDISLAGRAPKQNPTLFALAIACQQGETQGKQYARSKINQVVRTGSHLFTFVKYLKQFGGWSRGLRTAVGNWYVEKDANQLAYQMIKYRKRDGYTHRDVLRLTHPKIDDIWKRSLIEWAVTGKTLGDKPILLAQHLKAMDGNALEALEWADLPWEALPDSAMNDISVWDKMLDNGVPTRALVRQLPRLTNLGIIPQIGGRTEDIVRMLTNPEVVRKSRIHPINVLVALKTYQSGHGMRTTWKPTAKIVDALDEMFYISFDNVEPAGVRTMNAFDISGSMDAYGPGDIPLTSREIAAAMAMVSIKTEPYQMSVGFTSKKYAFGMNPDNDLLDMPLSGRQRLDDIVSYMRSLRMGSTDCALPMTEALVRGLEIDTFVIYTDNETWHGRIHPYKALQQYRKTMGIDAKLIVVASTPTRFSIADPKDPGMLDISGFDSAVPNLISDFSAGRI